MVDISVQRQLAVFERWLSGAEAVAVGGRLDTIFLFRLLRCAI
tara:strand:+ start:2767 stop:2895 length:129 start_codon:yes stop_codon:yes gene_type:complete